MPHAAPGPPNLRHDRLRSALEFAVRSAERWQKQKPPVPIPPEIKAFSRGSRLPASALGPLRRVIDADEDFRSRLAVAATPAAVDDVGLEWLCREPGWEQRVTELVERLDQDSAERDSERALSREQRRRTSAEERAVRAAGEVDTLSRRLAERDAELETQRRSRAEDEAMINALRQSVTELRTKVRHAEDRAEAARRRLEAVEVEREQARLRAVTAEQQRDELLAARAQFPDSATGAVHVPRLRELSEAARGLADRLASLVAAERAQRRAVEIPRTHAKAARRATEFVLRVPGIVVLVDGYNVAKLAWPELALEDQRERMLDAVDGLARRFGTEFVVVIDGADVVGAHAVRRRLSRVRYSPAGVTADDVIRAEVNGLDRGRPVAVVTNDTAIRRDVGAMGANLVRSEDLVEIALS